MGKKSQISWKDLQRYGYKWFVCKKTTRMSANKTGCWANMAHTPSYCTICLVSETACIIMRHTAVMTHSLWDTWQSWHIQHYETHGSHNTSISMRHVAVMTLRDQETNPNVCALLGVTTKCKTKSHSVRTSHNLLCKQLVSKPNRQHETKHKSNRTYTEWTTSHTGSQPLLHVNTHNNKTSTKWERHLVHGMYNWHIRHSNFPETVLTSSEYTDNAWFLDNFRDCGKVDRVQHILLQDVSRLFSFGYKMLLYTFFLSY